MTVNIVCVGQLRDAGLRATAAEYEKRLSRYCRLKTVETDNRGLYILPPRAYKVALCVEGRQLSSEEFAAEIDRVTTGGRSDLVFVIGGADGLPEAVKGACDLRLSFSRMTFPHRLMRVILLEQIYRAMSILKGENYHHY